MNFTVEQTLAKLIQSAMVTMIIFTCECQFYLHKAGPGLLHSSCYTGPIGSIYKFVSLETISLKFRRN